MISPEKYKENLNAKKEREIKTEVANFLRVAEKSINAVEEFFSYPRVDKKVIDEAIKYLSSHGFTLEYIGGSVWKIICKP